MISALLLGCALAGQVEAPADDDLQRTVLALVGQLNALQQADRNAAEKRLIELGPKVLELLPPAGPRTPPETRLRLTRIRQQLEQAAAESAADASRITLRGDGLPLSKVLAALEEQSGNPIVDFRERFGQPTPDPPLKIDFDDVPFWQALDGVLDRADLTVYGFGKPGAITVVARGESQAKRADRVCYSGPLRFEPTSIVAERDLRDPLGQSLRLAMEVAWEPRIRPIALTQKMADVTAVDEQGDSLALDESFGELEFTPDASSRIELTLPLKLPPRSVEQIASLKGRLTAMIPGRVETFRFDNLIPARDVSKRTGSVTVTLLRVRRNNAVWEVLTRVRFDQAGNALESHRGWIDRNEAYLEDPDGKPIQPDTQEYTRQGQNVFGVSYVFVLGGPPEEHVFVYKTPGAIVSTGFDYEIKGVKLP